MNRHSFHRIWAHILLVSILVSAGNYYLKWSLFGQHGIDVLFLILFVSLLSLGFMLRPKDQMEEKGGITMERVWSSTQRAVRRGGVGMLGNSDFKKMLVCFGVAFGWATAFAYWASGIYTTWIRIVLLLPPLLLAVTGFFFGFRSFWRMRS